MPELPEVETVRAGIAPALTGARIGAVWSDGLALRRPLPPDFVRAVVGRRIEEVGRRGKVLVWRLDDGAAVLIHLGMSGCLRLGRGGAPAPGRHDHLRFSFDTGAWLVFHDPRRFGFVDRAAPGRLAADPLLARLGPEPLDRGFTGAVLAARLAGLRAPLKCALLDQSVVAGLGNIYVCEALFLAGLSPFVPAGSLKRTECARLARAIRTILARAVAAGGSSIRDHRTPAGELGYFQLSLAVYGRAGGPCGRPCGERDCPGVARSLQGGRSTFYCPLRQGKPGGGPRFQG